MLFKNRKVRKRIKGRRKKEEGRRENKKWVKGGREKGTKGEMKLEKRDKGRKGKGKGELLYLDLLKSMKIERTL